MSADAGDPPPASVIRHEQQLRVDRERVPTERIRVRKVIVTEQRTLTVEVRREEVHITREPLLTSPDGQPDTPSTTAAETPLVVIRYEEQIHITKSVVPVERITVTAGRVTESQQVTAAVDREVVDILRSTDASFPAAASQGEHTELPSTDRTL